MNIEYLCVEFMRQIAHEIPHTLSTDQLIKIRHSLVVLKVENQFENIYFLGRINGLHMNYYISFGYANDCVNQRQYFYSTDAIEWFLLETWKNIVPEWNSFVWKAFQGNVKFIHEIEIVRVLKNSSKFYSNFDQQ